MHRVVTKLVERSRKIARKAGLCAVAGVRLARAWTASRYRIASRWMAARPLRRVYVFSAVLLIGGWIVGGILQPLQARLDGGGEDQSLLGGGAGGGSSGKFTGKGTYEVPSTLHDEVADKDLPQDVIDARTQGEEARERAIKEAVGKVFPKEGDWGMGGPLLPFDIVRPRPRPELTQEAATPFTDVTPLAAFAGPSSPFPAPGDATIPPHIGWVDTYPPPVPPPPSVPEPATWALMILAFFALARRLKSRWLTEQARHP